MRTIARLSLAALAALIIFASPGVLSSGNQPAHAATIAAPHLDRSQVAPAFYIAGFYDPLGRFCTGLFSDNGTLLTFWGCHYTFGAQAAGGRFVTQADMDRAIDLDALGVRLRDWLAQHTR